MIGGKQYTCCTPATNCFNGFGPRCFEVRLTGYADEPYESTLISGRVFLRHIENTNMWTSIFGDMLYIEYDGNVYHMYFQTAGTNRTIALLNLENVSYPYVPPAECYSYGGLARISAVRFHKEFSSLPFCCNYDKDRNEIDSQIIVPDYPGYINVHGTTHINRLETPEFTLDFDDAFGGLPAPCSSNGNDWTSGLDRPGWNQYTNMQAFVIAICNGNCANQSPIPCQVFEDGNIPLSISVTAHGEDVTGTCFEQCALLYGTYAFDDRNVVNTCNVLYQYGESCDEYPSPPPYCGHGYLEFIYSSQSGIYTINLSSLFPPIGGSGLIFNTCKPPPNNLLTLSHGGSYYSNVRFIAGETYEITLPPGPSSNCPAPGFTIQC